jgi:hypothetical protein
MDVKTLLRTDRVTKVDKNYTGVLRRDGEEHYTFTEMLPWSGKRNPRVFNGRYISITRRDNGMLRLNFKPINMGADFSIDSYALGVANELMWALEGLVEE